ncbi:MAG: DUF4112 domain-containing protein [Nevskiales bacterium]
MSAEQELALRRRLERLTHLLDDVVTIPGTRWRVGLDFLIGLIPVGGDVLGALLSLWLVGEAQRVAAPRRLIWRMLGNVGVETLVGVVPLVGDVFDAYWKANRRNLRLLIAHLDAPAGRSAPKPRRVSVWLLLLAGLGIVMLIWLLYRTLLGVSVGA